MEKLEVNCYSGHTYAERPESFQWKGIDRQVEEVEKAWVEPGERHFRIRTTDNKRLRLCYNEKEGEWSATEITP